MAVRRTVLVGAAGAFVVVAGVAPALSLTTFGERDAGSSAPPQSAVDPAHAVTAQVRTLLVSAAMPDPSEPGLLLHAQLREGPMPARGVPAEVLTDEDCAPDSSGISHCRNALRLEGGRTIVVRHPHDMRQVPCLTPGEPVVVRPAT